VLTRTAQQIGGSFGRRQAVILERIKPISH
jgi:hypothetical protein